MPVRTGKDKTGCYAIWGSSGRKYYFECGNEEAKKKAQGKASKQGQAVHASGWKEK